MEIVTVIQILLGLILLISGLLKLVSLLLNYIYQRLDVPLAGAGAFYPGQNNINTKRKRVVALITGIIYLLACVGLLVPGWQIVPPMSALSIVLLIPVAAVIDNEGKTALSFVLDLITLSMSAFIVYEYFFYAII